MDTETCKIYLMFRSLWSSWIINCTKIIQETLTQQMIINAKIRQNHSHFLRHFERWWAQADTPVKASGIWAALTHWLDVWTGSRKTEGKKKIRSNVTQFLAFPVCLGQGHGFCMSPWNALQAVALVEMYCN